MIFIHLEPYGMALDTLGRPGGHAIWFVRLSLGQASVALLSFLSGLLLFHSAQNRSWPELVRARVWTLLVPLVAWNLLGGALQAAWGVWSPDWSDPIAALTDVAALNGTPRLAPTYFLRDLFVCVLLSGGLLWVFRRLGHVAAAVMLPLMLWSQELGIFINALVPMFFVAGLIFGVALLRRIDDASKPQLALVLLLLLFLSLPSFALQIHRVGIDANATALAFCRRGLSAVLIWRSTQAIVRHASVRERLVRKEPYSFFVFCAHPLLIALDYHLLEAIGMHAPRHNLALFMALPVIVYAQGVAALAVLRLIAPSCARLLTGKHRRGSRPVVTLARS